MEDRVQKIMEPGIQRMNEKINSKKMKRQLQTNIFNNVNYEVVKVSQRFKCILCPR